MVLGEDGLFLRERLTRLSDQSLRITHEKVLGLYAEGEV